MTNNSISFVSLSLDNGSRMTRQWLDHGSTIPRKLFSLLFVLFFCIGQMWGAAPSGWSLVTSLSGISAGDKIIIVTNDGNKYMNGSVSSGHFSTTSLTASAPASASAAGVIELVSTGTANKYKLKFVSTNKYATATAASSGNAKVDAASDNYGWTFSYSDGFNAQYQETNKKACMRSYNNATFRTYANTSSGATFKIYKYSSAASHTLSSAVSPVGGGNVSLSATSIAEGTTATATATPADHYTFTSWSISGTGASLSSTTTNPTTVTMGTANATVTANFTAVPKASITLSEAGTTTTDETTYYVGDEYTLPSSTEATCNGKVLVGWSTVEVAETNTKPTLNYYEKGAKVTLAATQTFYAVFATAGSPVAATLSATYSSHSGWTASDCCGSSYWILCSGASITSPVISDLSTVTSITFKARTYGGATYNTVNVKTSGNVVVGSASASNTTLTDKTINVSGLTGSGALIFTGSATSNANGPGLNDITIHYQTVSYSKYATSCCQPLASINGSFFRCHFWGRNLEFSSYHYVKGRFAHF